MIDGNDLLTRTFISQEKPVLDVCDEITSASFAIASSDFGYVVDELEDYLSKHSLPLTDEQCFELKENVQRRWSGAKCWSSIDINVLANPKDSNYSTIEFGFTTTTRANSVYLSVDAITGSGKIMYITDSHNYLDRNSSIVAAFKDTDWINADFPSPESELLDEQLYYRDLSMSDIDDVIENLPEFSVHWGGSEEDGFYTLSAYVSSDIKPDILQMVYMYPELANKIKSLCEQKIEACQNAFIPSNEQIAWREQDGKYDHEYYENKRNEVMDSLKTLKAECEHILQDPSYCPEGAVKMMSSDELDELKDKVLEVRIKTLSEFAKSENRFIRGAVATNINTPPEILAELAKDKDWQMRRAVAENKNTLPDTLLELADDEKWDVQDAAKSNPNYKNVELCLADQETLKKALSDKSMMTRLEARYELMSHNESFELPENFWNMQIDDVYFLDDILEYVNAAIGLGDKPVAQNLDFSDIEEQIAKLYTEANLDDRKELVNGLVYIYTNRDGSYDNLNDVMFEILDELPISENEIIDCIKNVGTIPYVGSFSSFVTQVQQRPEVLKELDVSEKEAVDLLISVNYDGILYGELEGFKITIAEGENTMPEILHKLSNSKNPDVRYAVAENKNTSPEILAELAKDEDEGIRKAAKNNPNYEKTELENCLADQNAYGNDCGTVPEVSKDEQDKNDKSQSNNEISDDEEPEIS